MTVASEATLARKAMKMSQHDRMEKLALITMMRHDPARMAEFKAGMEKRHRRTFTEAEILDILERGEHWLVLATGASNHHAES